MLTPKRCGIKCAPPQARRAAKAFAEPLLDFPRGALVHFAVTNRMMMMTTKLEGPNTYFLPFNLGDQGAAGNPPAAVNSGKGHRTHYLWEQVWQRDSWLEIIVRYLVTMKDDKKRINGMLFPRYHQLDATRKLVQAVLAEGVGQKHRIQHSSGSGKTNSIAWTAHFLADLHDAANNKLFSTVLVVSDRIKHILLGPAQLYEALRGRAGSATWCQRCAAEAGQGSMLTTRAMKPPRGRPR